jgi:hypothetical protein
MRAITPSPALLDIAVAAQAFHGLLGEVAAALADPELGDRRQHAPLRGRSASGPGAVEGARQAHGQRGGGFALQRQVGQHVAHQRLLDQRLAEGLALRRVVQRQAQRLAHQAAGAQGAVQPRQRAHGQDLRHAAAFSPTSQASRQELDLGAGVGLVAQLVLQALDAQALRRAVGQHARQEEARQAARRLRQHQEGVAHRRRHEPLVAGQAVARAPGVVPSGSACVVLARTSEPPCFSVMPMPMVTPGLSARAGSAGRRRGWSSRAPSRRYMAGLARSAGVTA